MEWSFSVLRLCFLYFPFKFYALIQGRNFEVGSTILSLSLFRREEQRKKRRKERKMSFYFRSVATANHPISDQNE